MHAQFSNNNFDNVLRDIYNCTENETEFVISHSHFDSPEKISQFFDVIACLPQAVKVTIDHCTFNEADNQSMLEFKLCLNTTHNLRVFKIVDSIAAPNKMDYLATALSRNPNLRSVVINGPVNLESPAILLLRSRQIATINGVNYAQKPGFFAHLEPRQDVAQGLPKVPRHGHGT